MKSDFVAFLAGVTVTILAPPYHRHRHEEHTQDSLAHVVTMPNEKTKYQRSAAVVQAQIHFTELQMEDVAKQNRSKTSVQQAQYKLRHKLTELNRELANDVRDPGAPPAFFAPSPNQAEPPHPAPPLPIQTAAVSNQPPPNLQGIDLSAPPPPVPPATPTASPPACGSASHAEVLPGTAATPEQFPAVTPPSTVSDDIVDLPSAGGPAAAHGSPDHEEADRSKREAVEEALRTFMRDEATGTSLPSTLREVCARDSRNPSEVDVHYIRNNASMLAKKASELLLATPARDAVEETLRRADGKSNAEGFGFADVDLLSLQPRAMADYVLPMARAVVLAHECVKRRFSIPNFDSDFNGGPGVVFSELQVPELAPHNEKPLTIRLFFNKVFIVEKANNKPDSPWKNTTKEPIAVVIFNAQVHIRTERNADWRLQSGLGVLEMSNHCLFAGFFLSYFVHYVFCEVLEGYESDHMFLRMVRILMTFNGTDWQRWHRDLVEFLKIILSGNKLTADHQRIAKFWMSNVVFGGDGWIQRASKGFLLKWVSRERDELLMNEQHRAVGRFSRMENRTKQMYDLLEEYDAQVRKAKSNDKLYMPPPLDDFDKRYEIEKIVSMVKHDTMLVGSASAPHAGAGLPLTDDTKGVTTCDCSDPAEGGDCKHQTDESCLALPRRWLDRFFACLPRAHVVAFQSLTGDAFDNVATSTVGNLTTPVSHNTFHPIKRRGRESMKRVSVLMTYDDRGLGEAEGVPQASSSRAKKARKR